MDLQLGLFPDDAPRAVGVPVGPAAPDPNLVEVASRLPSQLRLGTSSWSFPGWDGLVYDRKASQATLARHGLAAYSKHPLFRSVGLDRTYYRSITADDFAGYAEAVPPDFRFLVKADRLLTSPLDPEPFGTRQRNPHFLDAHWAAAEVVGPIVEGLRTRAGPILFQFAPLPPNLVGGRGRFLDRLHRFLDALPSGPLYAIELRTPSFLTDAYASMLEETGAAHCYNVHPAMSPLSRQLELISPFYQPALVIRWMLHAGLKYQAAKDRYEPFGRLVDEDPDARERIAVAVLDALVAEREAFVIANNKAEGSAPLTISRLARRLADWSPETRGSVPTPVSRDRTRVGADRE